MLWAHLASTAPAGTTKGSVDRGRSFEVRERRGPQVSFPESPLREGEGIRGGGTPLWSPFSLATPMQPPGAAAGIPRERARAAKLLGQPPPPGGGGFLEAPRFPRPPCRPFFCVPQPGRASCRGGRQGRKGSGLAVDWRERLGEAGFPSFLQQQVALVPRRLLTSLPPWL